MNNQSRREIEQKFIVVKKGMSLPEAAYLLEKAFQPIKVHHSTEFEAFHKPAPSATIDFIRVRSYEDGSGVLTIKKKDQGTNDNRYELNVGFDYAPEMEEFAIRTHGFPVHAHIRRAYRFGTGLGEVGIYTVEGDPEGRVFVEFEGESLEKVKAMAGMAKLCGLELAREHRSIYEIFVEPRLASREAE